MGEEAYFSNRHWLPICLNNSSECLSDETLATSKRNNNLCVPSGNTIYLSLLYNA